MNDSIYLSIDMDFWTDPAQAERCLVKFLDGRGKTPTIAVMNHQQLLPYVDKSRARTLVNVDYHSDLHEANTQEFHCGSWVSFVKWRKQGRYLWVRQTVNSSQGSCNHKGFGPNWNSNTDWLSAQTVRCACRPDLCKYLPKCVGIGLCRSPAYAEEPLQNLYFRLLKKYRIQYIVGDLTENVTEHRRPPKVDPWWANQSNVDFAALPNHQTKQFKCHLTL